MRDRRSLEGLRDEDIDRLLSGKGPGADGAEDLAAFVQGVQATYVAPPAEAAARRQIAAAAAAARQAAATGAHLPEPSADPPIPFISRWRRRTVFGVSVATLTLSLSAAAIATTATGGLAAQGDLPGPIQRVVAQAASGVGITLPSGDSASGSSGSGGSSGGPPAASAGSKSKTTVSPSASSTQGRGSHDGSLLPGGIRATATPQTGDGRGGRGGDDGSADGSGGATATSASHGNCVAYAEQLAGTLDLGDSGRSTFVSLVDDDRTAVTVRVSGGARPDAACQSSIDRARASVAAGGGSPGGGDQHPGSGPGHGKDASPAPTPSPTPTATPTPTPSSDLGSDRKGAPTPTPSPSGSVHGGRS
jgi:hypothetical protein